MKKLRLPSLTVIQLLAVQLQVPLPAEFEHWTIVDYGRT